MPVHIPLDDGPFLYSYTDTSALDANLEPVTEGNVVYIKTIAMFLKKDGATVSNFETQLNITDNGSGLTAKFPMAPATALTNAITNTLRDQGFCGSIDMGDLPCTNDSGWNLVIGATDGRTQAITVIGRVGPPPTTNAPSILVASAISSGVVIDTSTPLDVSGEVTIDTTTPLNITGPVTIADPVTVVIEGLSILSPVTIDTTDPLTVQIG